MFYSISSLITRQVYWQNIWNCQPGSSSQHASSRTAMPGDLQTTTGEEGTDYISHSMVRDTLEGEWDTMRCDALYSEVVVRCVGIEVAWRRYVWSTVEGYSAEGVQGSVGMTRVLQFVSRYPGDYAAFVLHLYCITNGKLRYEPVIRRAFLWKLPIVLVGRKTRARDTSSSKITTSKF